VAVAVRMRHEGPVMAGRFGEAHLEYRKKTGRLLPGL
jgi:protein-S-isoprenylcysteine O-methyltransferase Ste14